MQSVRPEPHIVAQAPRTQNCPRGQAVPQVPQLRTSLVVLTHTSAAPAPPSAPGPGQRTSSSMHRTRQRPDSQAKPSAQAFPQAPQWARSLVRSAQVRPAPASPLAVAHSVMPIAQPKAHWPLEHSSLVAHARPQRPQLRPSV